MAAKFKLRDYLWTLPPLPARTSTDASPLCKEVRRLIDHLRFHVGNETYSPDEIAVRFWHRLVSIHPFRNGNGRLSRLAADLLAIQLGEKPFSWRRISLVDPGATRRAYMTALQAAHGHDIDKLLAFATI